MAAFGYLVYLVRASVPFRPKELQRLSAVGDDDEDVLDLLEQAFSELGQGYHALPRSAEGFRVREAARASRELWTRVNRGPQGSRGEAYDLDTAMSVETTERQALLSGLRAMFVVPRDSYLGLLFVERIGARHLKELLARTVLEAVTTSSGVLMRLEAYAEAEDWQRELAGSELIRVSELLHSSHGAEDRSSPEDKVVRVVTEGSAVRAAGGVVKELLATRFGARQERLRAQNDLALLAERRRARQADFTVQDEAEYQRLSEVLAAGARAGSVGEALQQALEGLVPVERSGLDHKRFDVAVAEDGASERSFVVESNAVPQFVYPLGGLLADGDLRDSWRAHAATILGNLGVSLPRGGSNG
jgi:hypothetical protein